MLFSLIALFALALAQSDSSTTSSTASTAVSSTSSSSSSTTGSSSTAGPTSAAAAPVIACSNATTRADCVALGNGAYPAGAVINIGANGACVWCGTSALQGGRGICHFDSFFVDRRFCFFPGECREPAWSGHNSCPAADAEFYHFQCAPGDTVAGCGSHCINSCETACVEFKAPVPTVTMFNDSDCSQVLGGVGSTKNLTQPCMPLASGGSVGVVAFANGTYLEMNYMCANCRNCEPTCVYTRTYCSCTRLAGSNVYVIIGPQGSNSTNCTSPSQSSGGASGGSGASTTASSTSSSGGAATSSGTTAAATVTPSKESNGAAALLSGSALLMILLLCTV